MATLGASASALAQETATEPVAIKPVAADFRFACKFVLQAKKATSEFCTASGHAFIVPAERAAVYYSSDLHVVCASGFNLIDENANAILDGTTLTVEGHENGNTSVLDIAGVSTSASFPFVAPARLRNANGVFEELFGECLVTPENMVTKPVR